MCTHHCRETRACAIAPAGQDTKMRILRLDTKNIDGRQKQFAACLMMCLITEDFFKVRL